ncbi:MAG TPA: DUF983 domain-containing protein [Cytophagales bacterium]|nr:DUF983 domain-containing protein [Cytophagales bacterium]
MIPKESRLYSIVHSKCPRCHEGEIFIYKNPYTKLAFRRIHDTCSVCGQPFEPEPGFFQGAMYVSYAVSVALCFAIGGILLLTDLTPETILIIMSVILFLLLPVIFRVSRLIWLNLFIGYKPNVKKV